MDYGMKVSKDGYDVKTETDKRNLVYTSALNSIKIKQVITDSKTLAGFDFTLFTYPHGLPYIPMAMMVYEETEGSGLYVISQSIWEWPRDFFAITTVDNTNINIYISNETANTKTCNFKIWVLLEGAS